MFSATQTFDSVAYPGVRYTIKNVGVNLRREIELKLAKNGLDQRLLRAEAQNLNPSGGKLTDLDLETHKRIVVLENEYEQVRIEEGIEWVRMLLVSVEKSDGSDQISIDDFLQYAPTDIFTEINTKVRSALGLTEEETGNSQSPTTLPPVVVGATNSTNADTVGQTTSTNYEIALDSTPT